MMLAQGSGDKRVPRTYVTRHSSSVRDPVSEAVAEKPFRQTLDADLWSPQE